MFETAPQVRTRTREQISSLLRGYTLLEPGLVPTALRRPDGPVPTGEEARSNGYATVGLLR